MINIADYYTPWNHYRTDKSNSAPIHDDGLTVGLEFELGESEDDCQLLEMINDGYLETADSGRAAIQLEYEAQSDVEYELVFNGDYIREIEGRLDVLEDYRVLDYVNQHHECSAHVHINRAYIEDDLGLDEMDYYKAAEFLAPFIYKISGRNSHAWKEWTPSRISHRIGLQDRAADVDDVQAKSYRGCGGTSARYDLTNLANDATIELRGFSSFYKDVELIKIYIQVAAELIPSVALAMQGKTYKTDYWRAVDLLQSFIASYSYLYDYFDLDAFTTINVEVLKLDARERAFEDAIIRRSRLNDRLDDAERYLDAGNVHLAAKYVLDAVYNDQDLKLRNIPLDADALAAVVADLRLQGGKLFKNRVWSA